MAAIRLTDYSRTIVMDHNSLIVRKFVLRVNFSVDFNFAGFFNELRFLECASDYVGFHISPAASSAATISRIVAGPLSRSHATIQSASMRFWRRSSVQRLRMVVCFRQWFSDVGIS